MGIVNRIADIEEMQAQAIAKKEDLNAAWPNLAQVYNTLVDQQKEIYLRAANRIDALENATKQEFIGFKQVADIFYQEVKLAFQLMETKNKKDQESLRKILESVHSSNMSNWNDLVEESKVWRSQLDSSNSLAMDALDRANSLELSLRRERNERARSLLASKKEQEARMVELREEYAEGMREMYKRLKGRAPESVRSDFKEESKKKIQKLGEKKRLRKKSISFTTVTDPATGKEIVIDLTALAEAQKEEKKKKKEEKKK
jgi:hypothetical protein